jgi:hypothetical protein
MRTERKFSYTESDTWEKVDQWQTQLRWTLLENTNQSRHYQKTSLLAGPKMNIKIMFENNFITIQAWLAPSKMNKLLTLGMQSDEVSVDTKSKSTVDNIIGVVPQAANRAALNTLLNIFGQEAVK